VNIDEEESGNEVSVDARGRMREEAHNFNSPAVANNRDDDRIPNKQIVSNRLKKDEPKHIKGKFKFKYYYILNHLMIYSASGVEDSSGEYKSEEEESESEPSNNLNQPRSVKYQQPIPVKAPEKEHGQAPPVIARNVVTRQSHEAGSGLKEIAALRSQ